MITLPNIETITPGKNKLESLDFYLKLVRSLVRRVAPTIQHGLSAKILKDDDAVAYIALHVMRNELNYDEEKASLSTYRISCVRWGIQKYLTHIISAKHYHQLDERANLLEDNEIDTPPEYAARNEAIQYVRQEVSSDYWTDEEKYLIEKVLMNGMSISRVATQMKKAPSYVKKSLEDIKTRLRRRLQSVN